MPQEVRILCMEDNEGTARLLQKRLSRSGYVVEVASSGETGIERCIAQPYDAVILDYNLPGMNGIQVLQQLAAHTEMPPAIVLTGSGNERLAVEALKLGAFDYIVKDIDGVYFDLLPAVIEQALKSQRLVQDKRRAEIALRESEKRFRGVIQQSLDGIVLFDQDGVVIEWNHAQEMITGIGRDEALGHRVWDVVSRIYPPGDRKESVLNSLRDTVGGMLDGQELAWLNQVFEYEITRLDGEKRIVQAARFPIDLGDRLLISEVARDVTDRKLMEKALRESEDRFRMLFEEAPDPYFVADLDGVLLDCNHAVGSLIGKNSDEMIGKSYEELEIFTPDQIAKFPQIIAAEYSGSIEMTLCGTGGRQVVVDLRMMPIQIAGQTRLLGIAHDITWRKQAEAQMTTHIEQLATLHRVDHELTRRLDPHYVRVLALDVMMRLSGANAGSISFIDAGKVLDVHSVGYPAGPDRQFSLASRAVVARAVHERRAEWIPDVTQDPEYVAVLPDTCSLIIIPLISQERLVGVVGLEANRPEQFSTRKFEFLKLVAARIATAVDNARLYDSVQRQLAELRELYEQVQALERLKSDMVRIVSHDLNNPLSVIATSLYLLEKTLGSSIADDQRHYIGQMNRAMRRMKALTTDVLSVEHIEQRARGDLDAETLNFTELTQEIVEACRTQAERNNQAMSFVAPELPVCVMANKIELQQAISNLVDNAIKYTPEGGEIHVLVKRQTGLARLEVIDSGYGVPEAAQATLFQPFERARTEETRSIEGTGLGLYIVKKFVERNGGEIVFASEHGKGSVFGFTLPLASE